jgi:hypothetical protein
MKSGTHLRTGAMVLLALLAIAAQPSAWGQTFTTFDPPGSQGTSPVSINPAGQITGNYFDANFATHGFLRAADGTITTFDAPGASDGTFPVAITPQGLIVGTYFDGNFAMQIFLRAKDGTFTTLEIPSPGATFVGELVANSAGAIAGEYIDSNGNASVFLRSPSGNFTLFELPPAFSPSFFAPNITAINAGGTILGNYIDANFGLHGWLRTIDGNFITFDPSNGGAFSFGAAPSSINDSGVVAGFYNDTTKNNELRAFLRAANGTFSSFDTPQLGNSGGAASINSSGAVAGNVQDFVCTTSSCTSTLISFLRSTSGTVNSVNDPQAVQGTQVIGINPAGEIIGGYSDANNVQHGFVRKT